MDVEKFKNLPSFSIHILLNILISYFGDCEDAILKALGMGVIYNDV